MSILENEFEVNSPILNFESDEENIENKINENQTEIPAFIPENLIEEFLKLTTEQQTIVNLVFFNFKKELIHAILIHAAGGYGKSHVLDFISRMSLQLNKKISITSTTGISASLLTNATTLHSFLKVGIFTDSVDTLIRQMKTKREYKSKYDQLRELEILIIDEISLLSAFQLEYVNEFLQKIRGSKVPFGGVLIIFSGDFYQLAPVAGEETNYEEEPKKVSFLRKTKVLSEEEIIAKQQESFAKEQKEKSKGQFCFRSKIWNSMFEENTLKIVDLTKSQRTDNLLFQEILQKIRTGKYTLELMEILKNKSTKKFSHDIEPVYIRPYKNQVYRINEKKKNKLIQNGAEECEYETFFSDNPFSKQWAESLDIP